MFEFLFKRPGDKPADTPAGQAGKATAAAAPLAAAGSPRELQAQQLAGLRGDEAGAADFILACEFSELRLAAAEFICSRPQLERVYAGIRNTDRRVAKLLQGRLDAIRHDEAELARGEALIVQADALVADARLTPSQVAELDRKWSVIKAPVLAERFSAVRVQLAQRLEAQVALQRSMIDRLGQVRKLATGGMPAAEIARQLHQFAQEQQAALAAPEHGSLPRSLTNEFETEHARVAASLHQIEQGQDAIARRDALLAEWQGVAPASLDPQALDRAWRQLPDAPPEAAALLRQRFDELLATIPATAPPQRPSREVNHAARSGKTAAQAPDKSFVDRVEAMEAALQHGSLGAAAELDKSLKESRGVRLSPALSERLAHARAELKRLSDWARWGGNVSREELIKAVELLATQNLAMAELAKKVGSMRERWKALDTLSGPAPRSLWERFDSACSSAYAPAAAHFKQLADERHANAARAEALIAEAVVQTGRLAGSEAIDWKQMALTVQKMRLAWSHLGAIDRKDKKRLDQQFADALNVLQGPLEEQRKDEVAVREQLIAQVAALNPQDRHAVDALKALQERWQEHARTLPLERKSEQALWQRFRAACDAVFARRKESAHAADAERRTHQDVKEAICTRLEQAAADAAHAADGAGAGKLLREAAAEWHAAGPVPRASEAKLDQRYQGAVAALSQRVDAARRQAGMAQASALRDKLRLCQQLETQLADPATDPGAIDWRARWAALPALGADYERVLAARFDAALAALGGQRAAYARLLEQQRATLLHEVLRLEIAAGIDSGTEFARERLKLQVETLQSSLKSGTRPVNQASQFAALCALPALADERTQARIGQLLARVGRDGK